MFARLATVACAIGLFAFAGCGPAKLNISEKYPLEAGLPKGIDLTAQPKPQKITVEFTSSAGEVSAFVFKTSDGEIWEEPENNKDKALATKKGASGTFSVDVPANTATRVVFWSLKKTEVNVK
ncbi:MAG TPA: hypothetical protein VGE74_19395, partial [Gemmata sp.]